MSCIDLRRLHYKCCWIVCVCVCNYSSRNTPMNAALSFRAGEEPSSLGVRSKPPVVLSFSHFVTGCCANGFLRPWPFLFIPPCSPPLIADHYSGLLYYSALGWQAKCLFVSFLSLISIPGKGECLE